MVRVGRRQADPRLQGGPRASRLSVVWSGGKGGEEKRSGGQSQEKSAAEEKTDPVQKDGEEERSKVKQKILFNQRQKTDVW